MPNVIAYMRVSTDKQDSIDTQRAAIQRYCEYNGLTVVGEYVESQSGSTVARPQLQAALARLGTDCVGLVVYKVDRLSRSVKDLVILLDSHFREHKLHAVVDKIDTSTAMGTAFLQLIGVFAELERSTLIERTKAGMTHRKKSGLTYCRRLYGFAGESGKALQPVTTEQNVLQKILEKRQQRWSFQKIADWLNSQNIPAPNSGKKHKDRPVSGDWHKGTVHRICERASC